MTSLILARDQALRQRWAHHLFRRWLST